MQTAQPCQMGGGTSKQTPPRQDQCNAEEEAECPGQQWKSTADLVSWFNAIEEKSACVFIMFDICEKLLRDALKGEVWAICRF